MKIVTFEIDVLQGLVDAAPPGQYTMPQLHGDVWELVVRPRLYGRQAAAAVRGNKVRRLRRNGKKSNRHLLYTVLPKSTHPQ